MSFLFFFFFFFFFFLAGSGDDTYLYRLVPRLHRETFCSLFLIIKEADSSSIS